jgi:hypothetical protein
MLLIAALGGSSGRDLGSDASGMAFTKAAPLLIAAELIKLAVGTCQGTLVSYATQVQGKWRTATKLAGYTGAALIAASGLVGIYAVYAESRGLGVWASALAFGSAGATAIWVIGFTTSTKLPLKPWHRIVAFTFAAASLMSLIIAPAAMLAGLLALAWWFGLSRAAASSSAADPSPLGS